MIFPHTQIEGVKTTYELLYVINTFKPVSTVLILAETLKKKISDFAGGGWGLITNQIQKYSRIGPNTYQYQS